MSKSDKRLRREALAKLGEAERWEILAEAVEAVAADTGTTLPAAFTALRGEVEAHVEAHRAVKAKATKAKAAGAKKSAAKSGAAKTATTKKGRVKK